MSTFEMTGTDRNYSARVIRVNALVELPGLDNLRGVPLDGYMALVSKDTEVGSLMVMLPAEAQLSERFAASHDLFRKPEKNWNKDVTGYLEDSARIRAIKLRGHVSSALLLPVWHVEQVEGLEFDTVDGELAVWKYTIPVKAGSTGSTKATPKTWKRVDDKFLPEHVDTGQWGREHHTIADDTHVIVTQKLHGTSIRIANTVVKRQLKWYERILVKWGVPVSDHTYDAVFGSRKVIKDANNPAHVHYYSKDLWTEEGNKVAPLLPPNVVLYGELIGWVPGSEMPIQSGYTYNVPKGQAHLYVYRVSIVTEHGDQYDLSEAAARQFCATRGLDFVPKLWEGPKGEFDALQWIDTTFYGADVFPQAVPLAAESPCDEGVVVRAEGIIPKFLKVKSPLFYAYETAQLDKGQADIESSGS